MDVFKTKSRTWPPDPVRHLRDTISKLGSDPLDDGAGRKLHCALQAGEEVTEDLRAIKAILYGDGAPVPEVVAQLAQETCATDLLLLLVQNIARFGFESRKDVVRILSGLLRRRICAQSPIVEYISARRQDVIFAAFAGYENEESAFDTGMILREMLQHEQLAKILLYSEHFYVFPHYIETASFGVSSDALANLREILTRHKPMVAEFLDENYDRFFASFTPLILSWNHITQRQSLRLLSEILLDRANFNVMTRYIAQDANLKTIMNLLRSKSRNVQFEAFRVFKVFVANPERPPEIEVILRRNKEKLKTFLNDFLNDKEDPQFTDEKQSLIVQIEQL